jgi:Tol biopolymer transport system component/tRNA A-37 threonylcarbamoyl transferase component Bud32
MPLSAGARLGVYVVGEPLGAGGMGVVYRARDSKLGRDVALKLLPDRTAADAERVARFEREARALAALHHPHIATLFGMEEFDGRHFLVMELVEGETLAERLARIAIPINEVLRLAREIADALEAAHDKGIVHRDLKPANIKITVDEHAKVLDFGLAKDVAATESDSTVPGTEEGVILGTAAYMSPEQARGKAVDRRTDVWAFGCVLYEMLCGKRAFPAGESLSDSIAAILTGEVDWTALPAATPPRVRTLLRRCLQKDPQKRLPHISAARFEIDDVDADVMATVNSPARSARAAWTLAALLALAVLAVPAAWILKPAPAAELTRFSITLPGGHAFTNTGRQAIAISPDGLHIVYVANRQLFARAVADETPRPIAGTLHEQGVFNPVFSPDGQSLAFVAGSELKRVAFSGGTAATVTTLTAGVFGISWSGDHLVFGEGGTRIVRVPVAGGTPEVLVSVERPDVVSSPSMLPGGAHLMFSHARLTEPEERWTKAQIEVVNLATGARTTVLDGGADGRLLASGHLVYATGGVVYAAPFDANALKLRGTPAPIIEGVRRGGPTGAAQFAISATGALAYLPGTASSPLDTELFLTDPSGKTSRLNVRSGRYEQPRLSPDGTQVAFGETVAQGHIVWVYEVAGTSAMRRLGLDGNYRYPVWSSDGQRIIFQSDREGDLAIYSQRADGSGTAERLTRAESGAAHLPHTASPDGRHLAYSVVRDQTAALWMYSFNDRSAVPVPGVSSTMPLAAAFSPDGRFLALMLNAGPGGRRGVVVMPFPPNGTVYQAGGGNHPMWSADGRRLFTPLTPGRMGVIGIETQPVFRLAEPVAVSVPAMGAAGAAAPRAYDVGRDGSIVGVTTAGNLSAVSDSREIRVALHWQGELNRMVPPR